MNHSSHIVNHSTCIRCSLAQWNYISVSQRQHWQYTRSINLLQFPLLWPFEENILGVRVHPPMQSKPTFPIKANSLFPLRLLSNGEMLLSAFGGFDTCWRWATKWFAWTFPKLSFDHETNQYLENRSTFSFAVKEFSRLLATERKPVQHRHDMFAETLRCFKANQMVVLFFVMALRPYWRRACFSILRSYERFQVINWVQL